MRNIIDSVDIEFAFRLIFKWFFDRLQRGKYLEQYQCLSSKYLLSVNGTQYYNSEKISCKHCLIKGKTRNEYYCH